MQALRINIGSEDIRQAFVFGVNPVAFLLTSFTGHPWQISDVGVGMELLPPYRTFVFEGEDLEHWRNYVQHKTSLLGQFHLELHGWEQMNPRPILSGNFA